MNRKTTAEETLALDFGERSIKCARLSLSKGKPQVDILQEFGIKEDASFPELSNELRKACPTLQNIGNALLITAVSSNELLIRPVTLKITALKEIDSILKYQLEPLLPFSIEESIIEKNIISKSDTITKLSAYALPKSSLSNHLSKMHELDLEPEAVSCPPQALAIFTHHYHPSSSPRYILHFQENSILYLLASEGNAIASHYSPIGYERLTDALCQDEGCSLKEAILLLENEIDIHNVEKKRFPHLYQTCELIKKEISKILLALQSQYDAHISNDIVITGPLASYLPIPDAYHTTQAPQKYRDFAIAIGLALSAMPLGQEITNFRQEEYRYPHPWKRVKRPLLTFATLCCCLAIALYTFFATQLSHKRSEINNKYLHTLALIGEQNQNINNLEDHAFSRRIHTLEKKAKKTSSAYSLHPNVPTVTQVLQWFNEHPVILEEKIKDDTSPFVIKRFNYIIVSYPTQNKPKIPYRVKVEMNFQAQTPQLARKLREALKAQDSIIDTSEEINWSNAGQKYNASFFLLPLKEELN